MATIKFLLQSKNDPAHVYLRLSISKQGSFKRKSGYIIDPDRWSKAKGFPKGNNEAKYKKLKKDLEDLSDWVEDRFNEAVKNNEVINGDWLQDQIDRYHGKVEVEDVDSLLYQIQAYIDFLPRKKLGKGKIGAQPSTIQKQKSLKLKISQYQDYTGKAYKISQVSPKWVEKFEKYLFEVDKLSPNTAGRYIKHLKTVCRFAGMNEITTNTKLNQVKGYSVKADIIYLSIDELEIIEKKTFEREALNNARDWLIIGCYVGQRVSDLLKLTSKNLTTITGLEMIALTQQKTGKQVTIPVHDKVKAILKRNKGEFPHKIADQKFNNHIKDVCQIAGIKDIVKGSKMVCIDEEAKPKVFRKVPGKYEKWELITSHVCRRSFATNFYGEIPTALLKDITAHSTELQFLEYIGKSSSDSALQVAEYWSKQAAQAKKEPQLTVLNKAN